MSRSAYYESMKSLARTVRGCYGLTTPRVLKSDLRRIYRHQGIRIDLWPHGLRRLRGAYFDDEYGPTVLLARSLPDDPMIFTMGHELKHHLVDRGKGISYCDTSNEHQAVEIAAEVFAAELIFPEEDFAHRLAQMGVSLGGCTPDALVRLKHETKTTLSYTGLAKRAVFLGFGTADSFAGVKWKRLEEEVYGEPLYKRLNRLRAESR